MISRNQSAYDALLIDLDGTLLDIELEKFIMAYVDALSGRFTGLIGKEEFIRHLFAATSMMVENIDPTINNETAFYDAFCPLIKQPLEKIRPIIDHFYRNDFPKLSCWGRKHPAAQEVVKAAHWKNIPLVLATNPIFPATATMQRLAWSGLEVSDFTLITTMEIMHFCKPQPEYYLEISEKINCSPQRCLMAGNDTLEDLIAVKAGMKTFLVEDSILQRSGVKLSSDYQGSLKDLSLFISNLQ
jgi:FMN phosphatase YigB (HAD superfamily)